MEKSGQWRSSGRWKIDTVFGENFKCPQLFCAEFTTQQTQSETKTNKGRNVSVFFFAIVNGKTLRGTSENDSIRTIISGRNYKDRSFLTADGGGEGGGGGVGKKNHFIIKPTVHSLH